MKPEFDVTADDTIDLAYTHALQVGRLPRQTRVDVADIVDGRVGSGPTWTSSPPPMTARSNWR